MTTIAYKDGILAGDQRVSSDDGHVWTDNCRKVFKLKTGCLFGASGDSEADELLLRGLRQGIMLPPLPDDAEVNAILVLPDGTLYMSEGAAWTKWPEPFAAIGSGKRCALAVMRLGHSAVEAVRAGIAGDVFSGGKVQVVKLKNKEKHIDETV